MLYIQSIFISLSILRPINILQKWYYYASNLKYYVLLLHIMFKFNSVIINWLYRFFRQMTLRGSLYNYLEEDAWHRNVGLI